MMELQLSKGVPFGSYNLYLIICHFYKITSILVDFFGIGAFTCNQIKIVFIKKRETVV